MYKPVPRRPKKTNIVRTRSGCKACRQRRVKCDEKKPSCSACVRHGKECEPVSSNYDFRTSVVLTNASHGVRYPKRSRVVYIKETSVETTVGADDVDTISDEPHRTNDALTPAPRLVSEEQAGDDSSSYQHQSPASPALLPLPLPSPIQIRSLGQSENQLFYLAYWEMSCAQSLPRFIGHIVDIANDHSPLMQALLALSACNMSRALPEGEIETSSSQVTYRPRREYLLSSQHYYGSAVQQIARSINSNSLSSSPHTLAVLVLFCYFESAMGNFAGFGCHAQGVDTFIRTHFAAIASDQLGRELTAAWILARNHNWWLRMHFSSFSLQLRQPSLALSPEIAHILLAINARRAVVTSILCESYRLNNISLLQLWPRGHRHQDLTVDQCITSLEIESKKLDEWHSALPQSELPIESFRGFDALNQEPSSGSIGTHLLLFTSHALAMNYAYYACSRLLQCTTLFHELQKHHTPSNTTTTETETETETNHWIQIILRIVAGLDKKTCFLENVYSIGISSLLAACLLRCHDSAIGAWIEAWLCGWSSFSTLEEGSFPIAQVWELTRLINEEKAAGNDIYAIALPEDDGGGRGKYDSYYSQHLDRLVLLGRRGDSRRLYSELVPVKIKGSVS